MNGTTIVRKDDLVTLRGSLGKWRVMSITDGTLRLKGTSGKLAKAEPFERPVEHVEEIEPQKKYVIVGGHYWGYGLSLAEAKKEFRNAGGTLSRGYGILTFDEETEFFGIDDFGRYEYKGNEPDTGSVDPN